jgi:hypothetical protein
MLCSVAGGNPSGSVVVDAGRPGAILAAAEAGTGVERLSVPDALALLASSSSGVSSEEAQERLARYGPNRLPELRRRSPIYRFLAQFRDFGPDRQPTARRHGDYPIPTCGDSECRVVSGSKRTANAPEPPCSSWSCSGRPRHVRHQAPLQVVRLPSETTFQPSTLP